MKSLFFILSFVLLVSCASQPESPKVDGKEVPERIDKDGIYELNSAYLDSINVSDEYTVFDIRFKKDDVDVEYYPNSIVIFPEQKGALEEVFSYEKELDVLVIGESTKQSQSFALSLKPHFRSVSYLRGNYKNEH